MAPHDTMRKVPESYCNSLACMTSYSWLQCSASANHADFAVFQQPIHNARQCHSRNDAPYLLCPTAQLTTYGRRWQSSERPAPPSLQCHWRSGTPGRRVLMAEAAAQPGTRDRPQTRTCPTAHQQRRTGDVVELAAKDLTMRRALVLLRPSNCSSSHSRGTAVGAGRAFACSTAAAPHTCQVCSAYHAANSASRCTLPYCSQKGFKQLSAASARTACCLASAWRAALLFCCAGPQPQTFRLPSVLAALRFGLALARSLLPPLISLPASTEPAPHADRLPDSTAASRSLPPAPVCDELVCVRLPTAAVSAG